MSNELERLSKRTQEMLDAAEIKDVTYFDNWRVDEIEYYLFWELVYRRISFPRLEIGQPINVSSILERAGWLSTNRS